jgi:hypothetical protein
MRAVPLRQAQGGAFDKLRTAPVQARALSVLMSECRCWLPIIWCARTEPT